MLVRILLLLMIFSGISSAASYASSSQAKVGQEKTSPENSAQERLDHDQWLKDRFSDQHEQLIPIVAVADMFYSCNKIRKTDPVEYQIKELITEVDKGVLAEKLSQCLADDLVKSEVALNFGLLGCFHEQLAQLPSEEKQQKMKLVKQAIAALSRAERQKNFTQCVTDQAIGYLK